MAKKQAGEKPICQNKTARLNFEIEDTLEAGIALVGTEVKALREGKGNLTDSFARVKNGEVFLYEMNISPYSFGNIMNHDPLRVRKLLLHKREIRKLYGKTQEKGQTVIPLKAYFKNGRVKILLGVGRGKKTHDRRQDLKKRTDKREMERAIRGRGR